MKNIEDRTENKEKRHNMSKEQKEAKENRG